MNAPLHLNKLLGCPISQVRAWRVILSSNISGRPCHYHMSISEIEVTDKWLGDGDNKGRYAWAMEHFSGLDERMKLLAVILMTQEDLAHYMADNSENGELWEDKFPSLDSLRTWLQGFVS